jgi:site-specific DNA recombinase
MVDVPKTMDGYMRVSRRMGREGPGYISPDVQREAIERWAEYKGIAIDAWHVDEDESGGTHQRPGLEAAVARAVGGQTGGIVAWKIDRFSRFTEGGLADLRKMEEAGARLAFVAEDVDTSGPMGRFVYTVMLAMSTYALENIKAGWRTAKARAVERGAHIGPTPFGYDRQDDGTLNPNGDAPIVAEAFKRAGGGDLAAAMTYLRDAAPAMTWTQHTTRRLLGQRVYLGEVSYGDAYVNGSAHAEIVDRSTFEAAKRSFGPASQPQRRLSTFGYRHLRSVRGASRRRARRTRWSSDVPLRQPMRAGRRPIGCAT